MRSLLPRPRGAIRVWWLWKPVTMPSGRSFSAAAVNESAKLFQPSVRATFGGLARMIDLLPMIWFRSIAF